MKVLVISGGSSGIGLGCVEKFLNNGYIVYNLDINPITMNHANYFYIKTDVCNPENILKSVDEIKTKSEKVDCLITSAGKHLSANIENTTNDDLNSIINLNILGTFWLIKSIIPIMKKQGNGSIITIGSDQSIIVKNNSTAYGLSKAATASLTKSVALDYAQYNIRANCIAAGTIDTPLFRSAIEKYSKKSGILFSLRRG
jgi:2-keto-3-deoxy-L-fuconate dehydrogenase